MSYNYIQNIEAIVLTLTGHKLLLDYNQVYSIIKGTYILDKCYPNMLYLFTLYIYFTTGPGQGRPRADPIGPGPDLAGPCPDPPGPGQGRP